jgi:hypothetical protein
MACEFALAQKPKHVASNKNNNNLVMTDRLYFLAAIHVPQKDVMNNEPSRNVHSLTHRQSSL